MESPSKHLLDNVFPKAQALIKRIPSLAKWGLLATLPFFLFCFLSLHFYKKTQDLDLLKERLELLCKKAHSSKKQQEKEMVLFAQMRAADSFFMDSYLETNQLTFTEGPLRREGPVQEVEEKQRRPIQVSSEELKRLLSVIERWQPALLEPSPQIIIKDFLLTKQKEDLFEISLELIKREIKNE